MTSDSGLDWQSLKESIASLMDSLISRKQIPLK